MWSSEPRESLAACRTKAVPSFLSYFKTLSIARGVTPGNSCCGCAAPRFSES